MGNLSERRAAACTAVSKLRRNTNGGEEIPATLVIVLPEDSLGETVTYLTEHHPEGAHLALHIVDETTGADTVAIISLSPRKVQAGKQPALEPIPIDPRANLGMLLTLLQAYPRQVVLLVLMEFDWEPNLAVPLAV